MPLDPLIANPASIKINDPMEQYGSFLKNAMMMDEIQKLKDSRDDDNATNNAMRVYAQPGLDEAGKRSAAINSLATNKRGKLIPAMQLQFANADKAASESGKFTADADKANVEAVGKVYEQAHSLMAGMSSDPVKGYGQYLDGLKMMVTHPKVAESLKAQGMTPFDMYKQESEKAKQAISEGKWVDFRDQQLMGAKDAMEQHLKQADLQLKSTSKSTHVVDRGALGQTVVQTNQYGDPHMDNLGTFTSESKTPKTNIVVHAEQKGADAFAEATGKGRAEKYLQLANAAESAPQSIAQIDRMNQLLNDGALVGALSKPTLDVTRYAKALGFNVNEGSIVTSQELRKMLANNVYTQVAAMKASGVPLTRLTNVELELVKQAAPDADMDAKTIKHLLNAQRKMIQNSVVQYNTMNKGLNAAGVLSPALKALASNPVPEIPDRPIPPNAIEFLKKNPETAAHFEDKYGDGTATLILQGGGPAGGTPNGGSPFPQARQ